jgi:hypothetical protein
MEHLEPLFPKGTPIHHELLYVLMGPEYRAIYDIQQRSVWGILPNRDHEMQQDPTKFHEEAFQIRCCLQSADDILEKASAIHSCAVWRITILRTWPSCPTADQLAILFHLLDNWSTDLYPVVDASLRCDRLSGFDILHVISFLVDNDDKEVEPDDLRKWFNIDYHMRHTWNRDVKQILKTLLSMDNRKLLTGFHKVSSFLNRKIARQASVHNIMSTQHRVSLVDMFAKQYHTTPSAHNDREQPASRPPRSLRLGSMMSAISINPTLAKSLSTCSTLESMRRLSTITLTSFTHRWSRFSDVAMSLNELSDQTSFMSISDRGSVPLVHGTGLPDPQEENPTASVEKFAAAST